MPGTYRTHPLPLQKMVKPRRQKTLVAVQVLCLLQHQEHAAGADQEPAVGGPVDPAPTPDEDGIGQEPRVRGGRHEERGVKDEERSSEVNPEPGSPEAGLVHPRELREELSGSGAGARRRQPQS